MKSQIGLWQSILSGLSLLFCGRESLALRQDVHNSRVSNRMSIGEALSFPSCETDRSNLSLSCSELLEIERRSVEYRKFMIGDRLDAPVDDLEDFARLAIVDVPRLIHFIRANVHALPHLDRPRQGVGE